MSEENPRFKIDNFVLDVVFVLPKTTSSIQIDGGGSVPTKVLSDQQLEIIAEHWRRDFFKKAGRVI